MERHPLDNGPIYKETNLHDHSFPAEPWNTFSNILFLIIVIYWSVRVYKSVKEHGFLAYALPVLFIGFVGGTIYHGTRLHQAWLLMDWMPIAILTMSASVYFMIKLRLHWTVITLCLLGPFVLNWLFWSYATIPMYLRGAIGYSTIALTVLLPTIFYLRKQEWRNWQSVVLSLFFFGAAVTFRSLDKFEMFNFMPQGTHWLWHVNGAIAVHFMIRFVYKDKVFSLKNRRSENDSISNSVHKGKQPNLVQEPV